ncbi:restriction endonuclease subunit S [Pontibaca methylaminivorans]|uniref:Type I restriction enzyme, S subunit n=1 Tax=Pontibaca methylaminivorans TaxID=515897 RepID=A0A1R3W793_9RHOB|nr:restriction endonuclease subunit S [Pontibaca methylaminivorans]SIT73832.1 type I restriction enzyme, S subunit [Pontibaca methylaminivorans]
MTELPSTWALCAIGDVLAPVEMTGKHEPDREIWYVDISSIDNQTNRITEPKRLQLSEAPSRARQKIAVGDVLFSTVRPYLRKIAAVDAKHEGEIASTGFAVLRGATGIDPKYIFFKAISHDFVSALTGEQYGVSYPAVKEEQVRSQPLELPPTNEQRRIVAKIEAMFDEIDKGVESLQTARATLGLYRQSLLKSAFEGRLTADWRAQNAGKLEAPATLLERAEYERDKWHRTAFDEWSEVVEGWKAAGSKGPKPRRPEVYKQSDPLTAEELGLLPEIPEEWIFLRLNDIAAIGSGMSVSKSRKLDDPVEVPYLRVANVQRGFLDLDEIKTMKIERSQADALGLATWDVLFNEGGDRDKLGRGWVWENQVPNCITQNHVFRASPFRHDLTWSQFISHWGNSFGRDYFEKGGKQTTNLASINKTVLKALPVPYCSPAEQAEIVRLLDEKLEAAAVLEAEIDAALTRADALRQSILKKAFSGQLVPQDPDDEPASALLERIKAEKTERDQAKRDRKSVPPRTPKARRPTLTDLIEVLEKQKSWISAAKAAQALGIGDGSTSDDVEAFYRQLKDFVEDGAIEVERRGDEDWLRLATAEVS